MYVYHRHLYPEQALCGAAPVPPPPPGEEVELCPKCLALDEEAEADIGADNATI